MAKSVVLNVDQSIQLARDFWVSMHMSSRLYWHPCVEPEETKVSNFAQSIIYYNHEKLSGLGNWARICQLAASIKPQNSTRTFDHAVLNDLIKLGVELPPNTTVETTHFEKEYIEKALDIIRNAWPAAYQEMQEYVEGIIVISDDSIQGQSAPTWFGAVFLGHSVIKMRNIRAIATSILHEVGHLVLFAQSSLSPPLRDPNEEFFSEFKQTKRPSIMVLHAQIALARMIFWLFSLRQYVEKNPKFEETFPRVPLEKVLNRHISTYLRGMQHLKQMPYTESGFKILNDFVSVESLLLRQQ